MRPDAPNPTELAWEMADELSERITDSRFRPRVQTADDGTARLYTGHRDEHVQFNVDGSANTYPTDNHHPPRIAWGREIMEVMR